MRAEQEDELHRAGAYTLLYAIDYKPYVPRSRAILWNKREI